MSNIPEGATHTYTSRGKTSYRRMAGDSWEAYIDGDWFGVMHPHAEDYVMIQDGSCVSESGLPSIGGKFEAVLNHDGFLPRSLEGWNTGDAIECVAHFEAQAGEMSPVFFNKRLFAYSSLRKDCYRPAGTAANIAAEKRDAAIKEMQRLVGSCNTFPFAELYDYGYRLQVEK